MNPDPTVQHLAYSTLVHPGDTWTEMRDSLMTYAPLVKARVSPDEPYAVSLRLSASSAQSLTDDAGERERLRTWLDDNDMYVYTVNAFPYGPFKGRVVMEQVYEPDWSGPDRVRYTCQVADILAEVTPSHVSPSIQTSPLAFRPKVVTAADRARLTENVLTVVAHLVDLERRTGRRIKLALEPEPACFLETTAEDRGLVPRGRLVGRRHREPLPTDRAAGQRGRGPGPSPPRGRLRHLPPVGAVRGHRRIAAAAHRGRGPPSSSCRRRPPRCASRNLGLDRDALEAFTDTIYLSQTTERRDGELTRFLTLADAITAWRADTAGGPREWRTHFHVPIFLDDLDGLSTTRSGIVQPSRSMRQHRSRTISRSRPTPGTCSRRT